MPKIFYNELHNRFNAHHTMEKQLKPIYAPSQSFLAYNGIAKR